MTLTFCAANLKSFIKIRRQGSGGKGLQQRNKTLSW
jgi:hypothetical protein